MWNKNKILLKKVKVGDRLKRKMGGFEGEECWENPATVIEITPDSIICEVLVDVTRTMEFDKRTGNNRRGEKFGWLGE